MERGSKSVALQRIIKTDITTGSTTPFSIISRRNVRAPVHGVEGKRPSDSGRPGPLRRPPAPARHVWYHLSDDLGKDS